MTRHTQGPWLIERRNPDNFDDDDRSHDGPDYVGVSGKDWTEFATVAVVCGELPDPTGEANAALIALAPDHALLLAAICDGRVRIAVGGAMWVGRDPDTAVWYQVGLDAFGCPVVSAELRKALEGK